MDSIAVEEHCFGKQKVLVIKNKGFKKHREFVYLTAYVMKQDAGFSAGSLFSYFAHLVGSHC